MTMKAEYDLSADVGYPCRTDSAVLTLLVAAATAAKRKERLKRQRQVDRDIRRLHRSWRLYVFRQNAKRFLRWLWS